jgi:hypothetical protein
VEATAGEDERDPCPIEYSAVEKSAISGVRMRIRTMMLAVGVLAVILATAGRWIASGCPVGFACGSCQTFLGARSIVVSSDHLLTNISLVCNKESAALDVEGRKVVVRGGEVAIEGKTRCLIPTGCKQLEFNASGGILRVSADGRTIQEIR